MSEIIFNSSPSFNSAKSQIENFQTTLASLNQQVIILQEALQEKEQEIVELEMRLIQSSQADQQATEELPSQIEPRRDETLTVVGLFINLYKFIVMPGEDVAAPTGGT